MSPPRKTRFARFSPQGAKKHSGQPFVFLERHPGGARSGLTIWLVQRASAVWLALASPVLLFVLWQIGDYGAWRALFVPLWAKLGVLLTVAAFLVHAWIGLREVMMDYVPPLLLRMALLFIFSAGALLCLAWAVAILWGVA